MKKIFLGSSSMSFGSYEDVLAGRVSLGIDNGVTERLGEARLFVNYLLENNIKVYGITTGFADLRSKSVSSSDAANLSRNIILSHDAGIGNPISLSIVKGAMLISANSLAKGYSAFSDKSLDVLVNMINEGIVPVVPEVGSLGASGDLAFLARLGRAMQGHSVSVHYKGSIMDACEALSLAGIDFFEPQAKEGLALLNGTSFMSSMLVSSFLKQINIIEHVFVLVSLFLCAVRATSAAFCQNLHRVRPHEGQRVIAETVLSYIRNSPLIDNENMQDDYCIRCIPQIVGPLLDTMRDVREVLKNEMNSVTDNPLIFRGQEIAEDVIPEMIHAFNGKNWVVISGGNFHGEYLANAADRLAMVNSKLAFTLERQLTYMLNPSRNHNKLPPYLITEEKKIGLNSGYMITQYTANALTQKIAYLGNPVSTYNITSANESEDIVSYGAHAAQKLYQQQERIDELLSIYLTVVGQAYAIQKQKIKNSGFGKRMVDDFFEVIQRFRKNLTFPVLQDHSFEEDYRMSRSVLDSQELLSISGRPFTRFLDIYEE